MEIKGVLKAKLSDQAGTSGRSGNKWRSQEWLLVVPGNYARHIKLDVRTEDRCKQWDEFFENMPDKNAPVIVKFDINAREWNGKWFNSIDAWDISMAADW